MSDDSRLTALVALNMIDGMGSVKLNRLMGIFGGAREIFGASFKELRQTEGIGPELAKKILGFDLKQARSEIEEALNRSIRIITVYDNDYPGLLKHIYDPPPVLYAAGNNIPEADFNLGIVGTRNADDYGERAVSHIVGGIQDTGINTVVISGMARGIDTLAHLAAVKNNVFTIAVLGYGLGRIIPNRSNRLVKEISENGLILSEFPLKMLGNKRNFPRRNRIISGLSDGVLVVEAGERSGALITVDFALEQGRQVFAVPGSIFSEYSAGCNKIISAGAKPVSCLLDIIDEFDGLKEKKKKKHPVNKRIVNFTGDEKIIYEILGEGKKHVDNISIESNIDIINLSRLLTNMELKGIVKQLSGKNFVRN